MLTRAQRAAAAAQGSATPSSNAAASISPTLTAVPAPTTTAAQAGAERGRMKKRKSNAAKAIPVAIDLTTDTVKEIPPPSSQPQQPVPVIAEATPVTNSPPLTSSMPPLAFDSDSARSSARSSLCLPDGDLATEILHVSDEDSMQDVAVLDSARASGQSAAGTGGHEADHEQEEMDVIGSPAGLAPGTIQQHALRPALYNNTPCTPDANGASSSAIAGEDASTFRRLNFTTKECATPGRYDPRQKLGQPLAVYCRVKPLLQADLEAMSDEAKEPPVMTVDNETAITCTAPKESVTFKHGETSSKFTFTRVFGPEAGQEEVFTHAAQPLVKSFYEGQNGLIFAYGITASGKTYTMQGTKEQPGLIPRIVADLFSRVMGDEVDANGQPKFTVKASYLEIYNETINDLLVDPIKNKNGAASSKRAPAAAACKLQSNKSDEVSVVNLKEVIITDHREAFALLNQGQANRSLGETQLNSDSSRSHSVFTLKLIAQNGTVQSRLSVVDLAGSERTNRVGNQGKDNRMRETVNINQSLLVLGRCLEALKYNQSGPKKLKVVPFRESQITRLFKDSLSGWGRTVMLTNASQNPEDYDETIHALKYSAIAKELRVATKVDSSRPKGFNPGGSGLKRQASQPLVQLDELEHGIGAAAAATGSTASAWDQDDVPPADAGMVDQYLDEIFQLKQTVVELELKVASVEMEVRAELTAQHEAVLQEYESTFLSRLDEDAKRMEQKYKKMFSMWKANYEEEMKSKVMQAQMQTQGGVLGWQL